MLASPVAAEAIDELAVTVESLRVKFDAER